MVEGEREVGGREREGGEREREKERWRERDADVETWLNVSMILPSLCAFSVYDIVGVT